MRTHFWPAIEVTAPVVIGRARREATRSRPKTGMPRSACWLKLTVVLITAITSFSGRAPALSGPWCAGVLEREKTYRGRPVSGNRFFGYFRENLRPHQQMARTGYADRPLSPDPPIRAVASGVPQQAEIGGCRLSPRRSWPGPRRP